MQTDRKGIFVTAIDTEVGKTVVAAGLMAALGAGGAYWKPVQTGTLVADDTEEVRRLTNLPADCFEEPLHRFPDPVSPHLAAARWNKTITLEAVRERFLTFSRFTVVEGAGGVLSPVSDAGEGFFFRDVMRELGLPIVLVTADRLGAINQTLLSLEALRGLDVRGVVFTRYEGRLGNAEAVEKWGGVPVLARLKENPDARARVADVARENGLRALVGLAEMPEI